MPGVAAAVGWSRAAVRAGASGAGGGAGLVPGHRGAADHQAAQEQHHRQEQQGQHGGHAAGPEAPLLGEPVQHPGPLVLDGHGPHAPADANAKEARRARRASGVGELATLS